MTIFIFLLTYIHIYLYDQIRNMINQSNFLSIVLAIYKIRMKPQKIFPQVFAMNKDIEFQFYNNGLISIYNERIGFTHDRPNYVYEYIINLE